MAFAKAMHAPLIFTSSTYNINVSEVFKIAISMLLGGECNISEMKEIGEPIRLFKPPFCPVKSVRLPDEVIAQGIEIEPEEEKDVELEEWDVKEDDDDDEIL